MRHDRRTTAGFRPGVGPEDRERALDLAALEMLECERISRQIYGADNVNMCSYPNKGDWPTGDCADTAMHIIIGIRGNLTKQRARKCAAMWRDVIARYPKAMVYLSLLGYAADPREIHEFPDAVRYVRRWARLTGMDKIATADRLVGMGSPIRVIPELAASNMALLAACGCFGEAMRQHVLRNRRATSQH